MDRISEIANTVILPGALEFYGSALTAIIEKPISAAVLFTLAVVAATVARSMLILAATFILALLALLASGEADRSREVIATSLGTVSLAILCAWTLSVRGRFARLRTRLKSILAEHAATKDLLDREIAWRQAADEDLTGR